MVTLVVAMADNRVIGKDGKMPWHIPAELKHFKEYTMGKPIIMGRKTFDSIGKVLPGRTNIIITRQEDYFKEGALVVSNVKDALKFGQKIEEEVCVIGGATIFTECLPKADRIVLTKIHFQPEGDTFFPEIEESAFKLVSETPYPESSETPSYSILILDRIKEEEI